MYRYSKGVNLVAGGEKHRVYVKKSPTGVGKGIKGHVMVNHPTEDKGKWDTIDLTEKAGAKTVKDGKSATKKWHKENPMKKYAVGTSGAKTLSPLKSDPLAPGNTTQYAPNEKFYTDSNASASANNTVDWGGKGSNVQNTTSLENKPITSKPPRDVYSLEFPSDNPNPYRRTRSFSNSFDENFDEDMLSNRRLDPMEQIKRFGEKNGVGFNYKKYKNNVEYLTPKTPKFSFEQPKDNLTVKPLPVNSTPTSKTTTKPKSGFAQYPNMKQGWFDRMTDKIGGLFQSRMVNGRSVGGIGVTGPRLVSGAKSVKAYRGDENLPEAKNGMKKNCGCKHSKSKYKYQSGGKNTSPEDVELYLDPKDIPSSDINDDSNYYINYNLPKSVQAQVDRIKASSKNKLKKDTLPVKRTLTEKTTVPVNKDTASYKPTKNITTVSGEKKIYIEKSPVSKVRNTPATMDKAEKYFDNYYGGESVFPGTKKYQLVDGKMVITKRSRWGKENIGYDWEDLSDNEKNKVTTLYNQKRKNDLQKEIDISNASAKYRQPVYAQESGKFFAKYQRNKELQEIRNNVKKITSAVEGKSPYKYGTGALTIPEGSAIVTANGGKNKQALMAYKKGNYKLLNNIIEKMPEDNVDKAQAGKQVTKVKGKYTTTDPTTKETYQEESVLGGPERYGKEMSLDKAQNLYGLTDEQFEAAYGKNKKSDTYRIEKGRREAVKKGNVTYNVAGKVNKDGTLMDYASGYRSKPGEGEKPKTEDKPKDQPVDTTTKTGDDNFATNKRKGNFLANIPSLAEIAARTSILGRGIENVPENYLALGRYNYASQLPKTLQEIQLAEQAGRESARDIVGGDAGRYLAQAGNLSAARMKAANEAVIQDTLARQDILNKNVDLGNVEAQVNTGLKNQFSQQRAMGRAAYDQQLIGLGQRIDSATETAQEMAGQRAADEQRLQTLRDLGVNYDIKDIDGLLKLVPKSTATKTAAKGLKKAKAYKRK